MSSTSCCASHVARIAYRVWPALAVAVFALVVFSVAIEIPAPWGDEAATAAAVAGRSWTQILLLWPGSEAPMVPYYYIAKLWWSILSWTGVSVVFAIRLLSACAMSAAATCAFVLMARSAPQGTALLTVLTLLSFPSVTRYAQEARPYALLAASVAGSWLLWDRWRREPPENERSVAVGYACTLAFSVLFHVFALFAWLAQFAITQLYCGRRTDGKLGRLALIMGIAFALVLPQVLATVAFGTGPRTLQDVSLFSVLVTARNTVVEADSMWPLLPGLALAMVATGLVLSHSHLVSKTRSTYLLALTWLGFGIVGSTAVALFRPNLLLARYWVSMTVPAAVITAVGISALVNLARQRMPPMDKPWVTRWAGLAVAGTVLCVQSCALFDTQRAIRQPDGHGESLASVLAIADAYRFNRPEQPLLITPRYQVNVVWSVRPEIAEMDPIHHLDPTSDSAWFLTRPLDETKRRLAGTPDMLWIAWGENPSQSSIPAALVQLGYVMTDATRIDDQWWQAQLACPGC